jgi:hypothetical protein
VELGLGGGCFFRPVRDLQPLQLGRQRSQQHPVLAPAPVSPGTNAVPLTHPSKLTLPAFWILEPAAWFALAEARPDQTNSITSQRVMFDLLLAALPEKNLSQVMDIVKNIPAINPFKVLKLRLLEAHVLSDQEKMDTLFQLGPLGDRRLSQLPASMLSVSPSGKELQPVFQYLFLQWLPQTLRTLLGEQECGVGRQDLGVPQTPAP